MKFAELLEISEIVIKEFIGDWQKTPYCWLQEIDIQVELVLRFREKLKQFSKKLLIEARHSHEPNKQHLFHRVTCEPYVKLPTRSWIHPDIVIWSDQQSDVDINSGKYPINLICEIKYSYDEIDTTGDKKRLKDSLNCESKPNLAIQLVFIQKQKKENDGVCRSTDDGNLIVYHVYLKE